MSLNQDNKYGVMRIDRHKYAIPLNYIVSIDSSEETVEGGEFELITLSQADDVNRRLSIVLKGLDSKALVADDFQTMYLASEKLRKMPGVMVNDSSVIESVYIDRENDEFILMLAPSSLFKYLDGLSNG